VTSTVDGPLYASLLEVLGAGSRPLSTIVSDQRLAATPPADVARAVDAGVALGLFEVSAGHVPAAEPVTEAAGRWEIPSGFNRVVVTGDALGGRAVALASERTGTGQMIGDLDAALLDDVLVRGRDQAADRLAARLAASGRAMQRDGKRVEDPAEQRQLIDAACAAFFTGILPRLVQLGIVVPAPSAPIA